MDYANAARFLKSYNKIESQLKLLYHAKATQNFTDLVRRCTDLNLTIRRYENELIDYGKLRNAIVHRTAGGRCSSPIPATTWWKISNTSSASCATRRARRTCSR